MKQWFTATELAEMKMSGLPSSKRGINMLAETQGWNAADREWHAIDHPKGIWRDRAGRGGGVEYHFSLLPVEAQSRLLLASRPAATDAAPVASVPTAPCQDWEWFDGQKDHVKAKAQARLSVLQQVQALIDNGHTRDVAIALISQMGKPKVSPRSIWRWFEAVAGLDRHNWLPALAPRHVGGGKEVELQAEAWEIFKGDYLRLEAPTISACYRRLGDIAATRGWQVPSEKSIGRRIEREIHRTVLVLAREGVDALKRLTPPLKRDRSHFHALEAINGDGHKWDVFVRWPDGTIGRPMMVAFQDLYSNKMLGWRFDRSENRESIRLALGDVVEQFGLPQRIWFDNTRAFANKWLTGGASHRYRFKTRDEDPIGLCESMGIKVHFTQPYSGQSKPIERAFRDMAQDTAKHPAFAGAYVGNNPLAKPENYGNAAVPFEDFVRIVGEEIHKWNAREGRRTDAARGRSFDQTFAESYAHRDTLIHKPSEAMMRQWRLAAEGIRAHRSTGSISLLGNEFWAAWMSEYAGDPLVVRFDPQNVHAGIYVYALDGRYLGFSPVMLAVGFDDAGAAREQARLRGTILKATKVQLAAERSIDALKVAAMLPPPPPSDTPEPEHTVIHHVFRTNGSAAIAADPMATPGHDQDAYMRRFEKSLHLIQRDDDI